MKTYRRINSIANLNNNAFMEAVSRALEQNEKDNYQSEIHYSYADDTFTVLILGYTER